MRSEKDASHTPAWVCSHVFKKARPVLLVSKADGDWQFLCGGDHDDRPHLVGVEHLLATDPSLKEVMDLQNDWEAERDGLGAPWVRRSVA